MKIKSLSDSKKLDAAIAVCEALGIDADVDDNLWEMAECINFDAIKEVEWATE